MTVQASILLPNGEYLTSWERPAAYRKTCHVAREHPQADDGGRGAEAQPFRTIQRAADVLKPGEEVVIHKGIYRECVRPRRGGTGPDAMIRYRAADGEAVVVAGSEVFSGEWKSARLRPMGATWERLFRKESHPIREVTLPPEWFVGCLPFAMINMPEHHTAGGRELQEFPEELRPKLMLKRGLVFQDGRRLRQVLRADELAGESGTCWAANTGLDVLVRPFDDSDPAESMWEFTVREQAFAPEAPNFDYIRVQGLTLRHCADGFPWPQRSALSTNCGTHWIVEDCHVHDINASGMDFGRQHVMAPNDRPRDYGFHIVRRNHIERCGITGICGTAGNMNEMLVEDNLIEDIGWHDIERLWENAAIKIHHTDSCVFRRNVIRNLIGASGIWLDFGIENSRITQNLLYNVDSSFGGVFIEMARLRPTLIDHNIILGSIGREIQAAAGDDTVKGGHGIYAHDCDRLRIEHNLVARCAGAGVFLRLGQTRRFGPGKSRRGSTCRKHSVRNNVIVGCGTAVEFGRPDNFADGNVYHGMKSGGAWRIHDPEEWLDFAAWREFHGWDVNGALAEARVEWNPTTQTLEFECPLPKVAATEQPSDDFFGRSREASRVLPGPFAELPTSEVAVDPRSA